MASLRSASTDSMAGNPLLRKFSKSTSFFLGPDKTDVTYVFCGQCLDTIESMVTVIAYCKQCNELICSPECLKQHTKNRLTKKHGYFMEEDLKMFLMQDGRLSRINEDETEQTTSSPLTLCADLRLEFNIRAADDKEICSIHSTAVLPNGNLVLADLKNSNLKLYDPKLRNCMSVLKFPNGPRDICLSNVKGNELYALESGFNGVHVIRAGNDLEFVSTIPCSGECFGVTWWKRGVAVTMSTLEKCYGHYQLGLLDYKGTLRRKFVSGKYPDLELSLPWYLTSNLEGQHVLISDYGNHRVTCVDVDGGVLFIYKDDDLVRPVSMATGLNDDIFIIGQRSHNIHHISADNEKIGVIYSENAMDFPGGIAYDKSNNQFYLQGVGWSDTMQVFKFGAATKERKGTRK